MAIIAPTNIEGRKADILLGGILHEKTRAASRQRAALGSLQIHCGSPEIPGDRLRSYTDRHLRAGEGSDKRVAGFGLAVLR
jgi:hypothetical protein